MEANVNSISMTVYRYGNLLVRPYRRKDPIIYFVEVLIQIRNEPLGIKELLDYRSIQIENFKVIN